jgi:small-conductance mechanosensitive channel
MRPWRVASAALGVPPALLSGAAFVLLMLDRSNRSWVWLAIGAAAALQALKWTIESAALRRHPGIDFQALYRAAPLRPSDRRLLVSQFVIAPVGLIGLFAVLITSFDFGAAEAALFTLYYAASWVVPLSRVWRCNSWLAISRLPARARRRPSRQVEEPVTQPPGRSLARLLFRWFTLVWLAISVVVLALVSISGFQPDDLVLLGIVWAILAFLCVGNWSSSRFSDWP